jgi:PIN domain nuclease of toxin-antitoxin system
MTHLLDTATWANSVTMPAVLPERVRRRLQATEKKALASVSLLECAILHRLGRLDLAGTLQDFFEAGLAEDIQVVELSPRVCVETNALPPDFQGDPFDRSIVATARCLDLILITADPAIRDSRACRVEYYPFKPSRLRA